MSGGDDLFLGYRPPGTSTVQGRRAKDVAEMLKVMVQGSIKELNGMVWVAEAGSDSVWVLVGSEDGTGGEIN